MDRRFFYYIFASIFVLGIFSMASAVNPFDISYPIPELGNCASQEECKLFCDVPENQSACMAWAERNGFISEEEAERIRAEMNRTGPGGCTSKEECDAFCENPENAEICINFAVEEGMMTQEEADFILEMMEREGEFRDGPGGPRPPGPDIDEEKAKQLIASIGGPGGCSTMEECENFCNEPSNNEACMNYAIEHELFPPEELAMMKLMLEKGGPGGCMGPEQCDQYCSQEENQDECLNFAKKHNLIPPEELEMIEKMMERGGPGGCRNERECDEYCHNPEHMEECMSFSVDMGMMTQEEADRMMEHIRRMEERVRIMEEEHMQGGGFMPPPEAMGPPPDMHDGGFMLPPKDMMEMRPPMFDLPDEIKNRPVDLPILKDKCTTIWECKTFCMENDSQLCGEFWHYFEKIKSEFMPDGGHGSEMPDNPMIKPCPAMPAVESCPPGSIKELMFSSPECGEYYGCVPGNGILEPVHEEFIPPTEIIPSEPEPIKPTPTEPTSTEPEPVSLRQPSLLGTVLGPFLDIFR